MSGADCVASNGVATKGRPRRASTAAPPQVRRRTATRPNPRTSGQRERRRSPFGQDASKRSAQCSYVPTIVTGVPTRTWANSRSMSSLVSATQPSVQSRPSPPSPWISIRLPMPARVGNGTAAAAEGEAHPVLVVRVVDQERLVVARCRRLLDLDDAVRPSGVARSPECLLAPEAVGAELRGVARDRRAPRGTGRLADGACPP